MKNLIALLLIAGTLVGKTNAATTHRMDNTKILAADSLLKYLSNRVKYPEKAKLKRTQGTSVILFTLKGGKLSDLKIHAELGDGADTDLLNALLAYPSFEKEKDGNYALDTYFTLGAMLSDTNIEIPKGYQRLILIIKDKVDSQIAGAWITPVDAIDGKNNVIVRGDGTNGFAKAMLILDGKTLTSDQMNLIEPSEIETVSVLKGASAIEKYGADAQFGVIIVTTKKIKDQTDSQIAGARITPIDAINGKNEVIVRGAGTDGFNKAMFILDGKILTSDQINLVEPSEIESVSVLKDASAIAQYGVDAQFGVIIVTTKTKKEGAKTEPAKNPKN